MVGVRRFVVAVVRRYRKRDLRRLDRTLRPGGHGRPHRPADRPHRQRGPGQLHPAHPQRHRLLDRPGRQHGRRRGLLHAGPRRHQQHDHHPQPGVRVQRHHRRDQQRLQPEPERHRLQGAGSRRRHVVFVGGSFTSAAGRLSAAAACSRSNVTTGAVDTASRRRPSTGTIRDLEVVGNRLWVGRQVHPHRRRRAEGAGHPERHHGRLRHLLHRRLRGHAPHRLPPRRDRRPADLEQPARTPSSSRSATSPASTARPARRSPSSTSPAPRPHHLSPWSTNLFTAACSSKFETYMTDVEYSPNGQFFVVSTTGAYGGTTSSNGGTPAATWWPASRATAPPRPTPATWTAYTGGDTTWTVEVTDNVVYAGGHQRWQNNPTGRRPSPAQGAVTAPASPRSTRVNGMPYSWNPTRTRGVGVQDLLATPQGLWVGSDTDRIGDYEYHATHRADAAGGWRRPAADGQHDPARRRLLRRARGSPAASTDLQRHQSPPPVPTRPTAPCPGAAPWAPSWSTGRSTRRRTTAR